MTRIPDAVVGDNERRWRRVIRAPLEPLEGSWFTRAGTAALFALGAAGSVAFLLPMGRRLLFGLTVVLGSGAYILARRDARTAGERIVRAIARAVVVAWWLGSIVATVVVVSTLAWAMPTWARVAASASAACVAAGSIRSYRGPQVPLVVPVAISLLGCFIGWARAERWVRCDEYRAVVSQRGVRVLVPSLRDLATCAAGSELPLGYYPRRLWESGDGRRVVFTTQTADHSYREPTRRPRGFGLVCESWLDRGLEDPHCLGPGGKSHAIVEAPELDALLVGVMSANDRSGRHAQLLLITRAPGISIVDHVNLADAGGIYYDPRGDRVVNFGDAAGRMHVVEGRTRRLVASPSSVILGADTMHYDAERGEGVHCVGGFAGRVAGDASVAIAFRGWPYVPRSLAPSSRYPTSWLALSWGCAWDRDRRRVYSTTGLLGQLVVLDYDSGAVLARHFIGFGARGAQFDGARRQVYVGDFLGGEVRAFDAETGAVSRRWHVGRFTRHVLLTRDGSGLLVSSSLGIVRIDL